VKHLWQWESSTEWTRAVLLGQFKPSHWYLLHVPASRKYARDWGSHSRVPLLREGSLQNPLLVAEAWPHAVGQSVGRFTCISWPRGIKRKRAAYRCQCGHELLAGWEGIARGTARCTACETLPRYVASGGQAPFEAAAPA